MATKQNLILAGDIFPSKTNIALFEQGDAKTLFGDKICNMFAEAGYSIANLEGALTDFEHPIERTNPRIKAPISSVNGIKALGIKALALANNHVTDYGNQGYEDTIAALQHSGIDMVGSGKVDSIKTHLSICIANKKICIYNVSETFFNCPTIDCYGAHLYDEYLVCNEIKVLKQTHDYLIVIYHGGAEYFQYPTPQTKCRFHRMADNGADFVVAQHTHCIGCEEYYKGSYLLYGQGNFLFARQITKPELTKVGLMVELVFDDDSMKVQLHKVRIKRGVLNYDECQDLSDFYERSKHINEEEMIEEKFKSLKVSEIGLSYLSSFKGLFPGRRIMKKLSSQYYRNYIFSSFRSIDILKMMQMVSQDRRAEDFKCVLEYLWDRQKQNN